MEDIGGDPHVRAEEEPAVIGALQVLRSQQVLL